MPIPEFVVALREKIGRSPLWLPGVTAVVLRPRADGAVAGRPQAGEGDATAETSGGNGGESLRADTGLEVLLVRRSDNGMWAPITGIVDPGEHPAITCVREAREEARVHIAVERLALVGVTDLVTHANGDQAQYLDHTFRCRWVSGEAAVGDDESTEVAWAPVDALPDMREDLADRIRIAATHTGGDAVLATDRRVRTASA